MENKSKLNTILLVIIIILLFVGLGYFFLRDSREKKDTDLVSDLPQIENQNNNVVQTENNKSSKIYKNSQAGYEVSYPKDWHKDLDSALGNELGNNSTLNIKNRTDAVKTGGDFEMIAAGSIISVEVNSNMNYSSYEEFIKDPKWYLSEKIINERLANLETITIGGKIFKAFTGIKTDDSLPMKTYSFIYNGKLYKISYISGSKEQFNLDYPIFNDFISSFNFL